MDVQKIRSVIIHAASVASIVAVPLVIAAPAFPAGKYQAGEVSMQFDGHGHFKLSMGKQALVDGDYATSADQIRLTDKSGPLACSAKGEETGAYLWKFEGDKLIFTKVEDACEGRSGDLPNRDWKRAG